jgi:Flp pilus assembly pilin Flp
MRSPSARSRCSCTKARCRGTSAIEYVLVLVLIAAAGVVGFQALGDGVKCRLAQATNLFGGASAKACAATNGSAPLALNGPSPGGDDCKGVNCFAPGKCFVAGTLVWTAAGTQPIESISVGAEVLTRAEDEGPATWRRVTRTLVNTSGSLVRLVVANDDGDEETLTLTPGHLLRLAAGEWHPAATLTPGRDQLLDSDGRPLEVRSAESLPDRVPVYNLEVDELHTYFVGRLGVWVHNVDPLSVAIPGERPKRIPGLPQDTLNALIDQLESQDWRSGLFIFANGANRDDLLKEALAARRRYETSTSYSVRSRTTPLPVGIILTDFPDIANDVRSKNPKLFYGGYGQNGVDWARSQGWEPLFDSPDHRTALYGPKPPPRGARPNASNRRGNNLPAPPPGATIQSTTQFAGPAQRAGRPTSTNTAMGGYSALNYAHDVSDIAAGDGTWEWLHLVGDSLGGGTHPGNLVAGTYDANTAMIPAEKAIAQAASSIATAKPGSVVTVTGSATVLPDRNGNPSWVGNEITLTATVTPPGGTPQPLVQLGPISALNNSQLYDSQYDTLSAIFNKQVQQAVDNYTGAPAPSFFASCN